MAGMDAARQARNLAFQASGAEFCFGDAAACPRPPHELATLRPGDAGVEALLDGGLSAEVLRLAHAGRRLALKRARARCRVANADGQTSFLNELQRHAELRELARDGRLPPGVLQPLYGSLRLGLIVSPWIEGRHPSMLDERQMRQLLASACGLAARGFFEWDYSPGNLLDDGEQLWLFDFGYMYRFDPLTQFNSAGRGCDCPQHHPAERIEGRHLFGALLELERDQGEAAAHAGFARFKALAVQAYAELARDLAGRGAGEHVLAHYRGLAQGWEHALGSDPGLLYLCDGWRAHASDLDDDLRGRSCTPRTLARADWLLRTASARHADLRRGGALDARDAALALPQLLERYQARREQARALQLG